MPIRSAPGPVVDRFRHVATRCATALLDRICPTACVLCDAAGPVLCGPCRHDATAGTVGGCACCAIPLAPRDATRRCGRCLRRAPAFDATLAAALYGAPFDQLVRGLKYGATLAYAPLFADLLCDRIALAGPAGFDLIVPVPLSRERIATRGFNQSIEIGRPLARRLDRPLDTASVLRIHDTLPQASLPFESRRGNMRGAFEVVDARRSAIEGANIAVVDDVMTTGATLDELARTLKRAGARSVTNLVVARTP